jgi:drug/metabolite transporter (DMT)-like permease
MTEAPARRTLVAAFAAIYLLWGSTFLALRYAVESVPPLATIAIRCVLGAAILFGWLAMRRAVVPTTRRQWATAAISGALLFLGGHAILAWAEQRVPSGRAALLLATIPLWLVVIEAVRTRRLPPGRVSLGLAAGLAGVALLSGGAAGAADATLDEHVLLLVASLAWALGSLVARQGLAGAPALQSTAMQLAAGGVLVVAASLATGEMTSWSPDDVSARGAAALAFLVVGGTVIGFAAYTWLLRVSTPHLVGTYGFVNPVVALLLAWAVGDEAASTATGVAGALIVGAVVLTLAPSRPRRSVAVPASCEAGA